MDDRHETCCGWRHPTEEDLRAARRRQAAEDMTEALVFVALVLATIAPAMFMCWMRSR